MHLDGYSQMFLDQSSVVVQKLPECSINNSNRWHIARILIFTSKSVTVSKLSQKSLKINTSQINAWQKTRPMISGLFHFCFFHELFFDNIVTLDVVKYISI